MGEKKKKDGGLDAADWGSLASAAANVEHPPLDTGGREDDEAPSPDDSEISATTEDDFRAKAARGLVRKGR